jgi:hypothetical protein
MGDLSRSEEDEGRSTSWDGANGRAVLIILFCRILLVGILDGIDNLVSSSSSPATPSGLGLGSSSAYASGYGTGFLGTEATPTISMYRVIDGW